MSEEDYTKLSTLLTKNRDIFAKSLYDLPGTDVMQHKIDTGDRVPPRERLYRKTPAQKREIEAQLEEMLKHNIIEESDASYGANIVLIKKKDGSYRFAVDYRKLNQIVKDTVFPLISLEDVIDSLAEATPKVFSVLDLRSGYQQIKLTPDSKDKTTFISHLGSHRYLRMPFGLVNSGASFGHMLYSVLKGIQFKHVLSYVDDCFVYSSDMQTHLGHLEEVFSRFRKAKLRLHPAKCQFGVKSVIFLGNVISSEGMAPDPSRIKAMKKFPAPKDVKTLRQLLGLTNYYRRYCRGYSHIIQPLLKLLRKNTPFVWDEECQAAFKRLIEAMTTAPVLRLPVMGQKFYLLTDASTKAIGYILAQKNEDNILTPVAYGGRSIRRGGEENYTVTELELLAILEGIKRFSSFLSNVEFEVISDHVALSYIQSLKAHHGRLGKWAVFLQGYNFKVTHIAGHKHLGPDLLSRREYPEEAKDDADAEIENMLLNLNEALDDAIPPRVRPKQSIEIHS